MVSHKNKPKGVLFASECLSLHFRYRTGTLIGDDGGRVGTGIILNMRQNTDTHADTHTSTCTHMAPIQLAGQTIHA